MCKSFNLCIANGRLGSDKFLGNKTCKGFSVIDYAIMSPLSFTSVKEFEILPFEPLVSDAHSGIHISLECSATESCQNFDNEDILITKATWKTELSNTFLSNLNEDDVECFVEKLALVSTNTVTKEDVEVLSSECSSLLFNAADAAGMISHKTARSPINPKRVSRKAAKKPWFNDECRRHRIQYRCTKNHRRRVNNAENFQFKQEAGRAYKNV